MNKIFTHLKDVEAHLRHLYLERGGDGRKNGGRIDGRDPSKLSKNENDQARREAEFFFEFNGTVYGLACDTTFDAAKRFRERLSQAINSSSVFYENKTRAKGKKDSKTRCLHIGNEQRGPKGWYCYEASYFKNWSDQISKKAA